MSLLGALFWLHGPALMSAQASVGYPNPAFQTARWEPAPVLLQCNEMFPLLSKVLHISKLFPPLSKSSQYLHILYFVNGNHVIRTLNINRFKSAFSKKCELFSIRSIYIMFYWLLNTWSSRELILAMRIVCESRDVRKAMNETPEGSRGQCYPKLSSIMAKESKAKLVTGMRVLIQGLCLYSQCSLFQLVENILLWFRKSLSHELLQVERKYKGSITMDLT